METVRAAVPADLSADGPAPAPHVERLLVCVSGSPYSEKLIRMTSRLADGMSASWTTLYIEPDGAGKQLQENREQVWNHLRLAESLGARVTTVSGTSVAEAIIDFAARHGITKIVVGKPKKPRWREFLRPPLVDRIIYLSGSIDVYVVSIEPADPKPRPLSSPKERLWSGYVLSVALVVGATGIGRLVHEQIAPTNLVMIYLLAVVFAAVRFGLKPAVLTAFLSVMAFDFFIIPPQLTLAVSDSEYLITFLALFTVGIVISKLVATANERAEAVRKREAQTAALYHLSRELAAAADVENIVHTVVRNVGESLTAEVAVWVAIGGELQIRNPLHEQDVAAAQHAFRHGDPAGKSTSRYGGAEYLHLPLQTGSSVLGVLGLKLGADSRFQLQEARQLLEAMATQAAMALERAELARRAEQAQILKARESLERALLNSVSHDLRTPLVSITGALSTLRTHDGSTTEKGRRELIDAAWEEAERLNRFVGNLLDMTRVEAGELKLNKEPADIQDLIGCALAPLEIRLQGREVRIHVPADLPLPQLDMMLMTQVLINLLENCLKYSPPGTPVNVSAKNNGHCITVTVEDRGPGVPESELERIFEKFYRLPVPEGAGGTGLGLSICKGIMEAHGGAIRAENRISGGLRVVVTIPLEGKES